jgi:hypothetical protein
MKALENSIIDYGDRQARITSQLYWIFKNIGWFDHPIVTLKEYYSLLDITFGCKIWDSLYYFLQHNITNSQVTEIKSCFLERLNDPSMASHKIIEKKTCCAYQLNVI